MKLYTTENYVLLDKQPLGSGAEGNVYEVLAPARFKNCVAKVYHRHEQHTHREEKIKHLIASRANSNISSSITFPQECIYNDKGSFMGFLMPKVKTPYHLTSLCSLSLPHNIPKAWYNKYARIDHNLYFRLLICKNLAEVVANLHQTKQYVFADLKPENIKINLAGEVFIIDVDSIQITQGQKLLYATEKVTPEYAPQEIKSINFKQEIVAEGWDRFSLGVIFYKVLLGLHPYTGTCAPPYGDLVSNEQKIQANLLPLGTQAKYFKIIPEPHQGFKQLPKSIQQLLAASFSKMPTERPEATQWDNVLTQQLKSMSKPVVKQVAVAPTVPNRVRIKPAVATKNKAHRDVAKLVAVNVAAFMILLALVRFVSASALFHTARISNDPVAETTEQYNIPTHNIEKLPTYKSRRVLNKEKQLYGLVDNKGKTLLPYDYEWIGNFHEGLATIVLRTKTGYINQDGKVVIPLVYDKAWAFQNGFARVSVNEKMALIDTQGKLLVPLYYDGLWDFDASTNGLARVEREGKYGFIDQKGKEVIGLWFDWADDFAGGYTTKVRLNGEIFKIDRTGKILERIN